MTDHQKAVCWDTLKKQLEAGLKISDDRLLWSIKEMEKTMLPSNTIIQRAVRMEP